MAAATNVHGPLKQGAQYLMSSSVQASAARTAFFDPPFILKLCILQCP
jgi:hypothetical protein